MVVTDGQSLDDNTEPAPKLRCKGVNCLCCGHPEHQRVASLIKLQLIFQGNMSPPSSFFYSCQILDGKIKKGLCNEIVTKMLVVPLRLISLKKGKKYTDNCHFAAVSLAVGVCTIYKKKLMQEEINIQKGFREVYDVLVVTDPNIIKGRAALLRTRLRSQAQALEVTVRGHS